MDSSVRCDTLMFAQQLTHQWPLIYEGLVVITARGNHNKWRDITDNAITTIQEIRDQAGLKRPFRLRFIDSQQHATAYGLMVYRAWQLLQKGLEPDQLKAPLKTLQQTTFLLYTSTFNPPEVTKRWWQLLTLRQQHLTKLIELNHQEHRLLKYTTPHHSLQTLLAKLLTRLEYFEYPPWINLSYAGALSDITQEPLFQDLHQSMVTKKGVLWLAAMDKTSSAFLEGVSISAALSFHSPDS